jgi:acyl-CoA reductase-like NAD-dependent aldehyde dehydrogenase
MREYQQYIGGQWTGSGSPVFDDLDPYRGTVMARVPAGTRADAARAVDAAAAAFPAWAAMPPAEKQLLFLRAADIVERRAAETKALLAEETATSPSCSGSPPGTRPATTRSEPAARA